MNKEDNIWESRYQAGTIGWDRGATSTNLNYWLDNDLLKPCRILVPGCGNGYEVMTLAKLGFDVVAIDIAPTAIENLKSMLSKEKLNAELILGDFFTWNPEEKFAAIFEQTSLCALSPKLWQQYETRLYKWLKPEGKIFAQFMQTGKRGGPPYHCELNDMDELFPSERWLWSDEYTVQEKETGMTELLYILQKTNINGQNNFSEL
jgi:cyclopropane fatty-acyl-phospholipid synthase-like methyltransferase